MLELETAGDAFAPLPLAIWNAKKKQLAECLGKKQMFRRSVLSQGSVGNKLKQKNGGFRHRPQRSEISSIVQVHRSDACSVLCALVNYGNPGCHVVCEECVGD